MVKLVVAVSVSGIPPLARRVNGFPAFAVTVSGRDRSGALILLK
jgi:hypothetical protein